MDGVMDGVQVQGLGLLGQLELAGGGAVLGLDTDGQVLLGGGGDNLAQQLGELGSVLSLFPGGLLPVQADLGIALAVSGTGHSQIHTDLSALAGEVLPQALLDLLGGVLGHADDMLSSPAHLAAGLLNELGAGALAQGADKALGHIAFVNIAADGADILLHKNIPPNRKW